MPGLRFDQIYKNITESTYFDNPIYVSFLILVIIFIIFYFNFNPICQEHGKFWTTMFRSAFYALIPTVLILCMHYKHLESDFDKKQIHLQRYQLITGKSEVIELKEEELKKIVATTTNFEN